MTDIQRFIVTCPPGKERNVVGALEAIRDASPRYVSIVSVLTRGEGSVVTVDTDAPDAIRGLQLLTLAGAKVEPAPSD